MAVIRVADPLEFRERTERFLLLDEARHNLMLGLTTTLIERPEVYPEHRLWVVEHRGTTVAAAIHTPPSVMAVSGPGHDAHLAELAAGIREDEALEPSGVVAAVPEVESFREAWERAGRVSARRVMDQRIYWASVIRPPLGVAGTYAGRGAR